MKALGKFITFEGGEGAGKSTQARLLADRLRARGIDVVVTREPGGSPLAEDVRDLLLRTDRPQLSALTEALLFMAARSDHLDRTIRPALAAGQWVICDRFADSTRVYQGSAGGVGEEVVEALQQIVVGNTMPDLTLILDLPAEVGLARAASRRAGPASMERTPDSFEGRKLEFHEQLRRGYARLAATVPQRCVLLDAGQSCELVADQIWASIATRGLLEPG